jgi:pimeloyl-ACP methyl ester carboxylesterase
MPKVAASDGTQLYVEESGTGTPVVFVHEYAGDYRSWEPQMRHFSRQHRCVTYSQRGYPPSDVPSDPGRYSQDIARDHVIAVLDALGIDRAHVVGHSMGAYTAPHVGAQYPQRCLSVTAAGCGWGSSADLAECETMKALAADSWSESARMLSEHSADGHAHTMLNLQLKRPTLWEMEADLKQFQVPLLVIVGDDDDLCLEGSVYLKRTVPGAALLVIPRAGHTINSEEPAAVNAALAELFSAVEAGRWLTHKAA